MSVGRGLLLLGVVGVVSLSGCIAVSSSDRPVGDGHNSCRHYAGLGLRSGPDGSLVARVVEIYGGPFPVNNSRFLLDVARTGGINGTLDSAATGTEVHGIRFFQATPGNASLSIGDKLVIPSEIRGYVGSGYPLLFDGAGRQIGKPNYSTCI